MTAALELVGALGVASPAEVQPHHVMRRLSPHRAASYEELFPPVEAGALLRGDGPAGLQLSWDRALAQASRRKALMVPGPQQAVEVVAAA